MLCADARRGLSGRPKSLPSKYFYDDRGSELFEAITRLPEYYLTRAETEILETVSDEIIAVARPAEIVELGSGSSRKTRLLLEAMGRARTGARYVPVDVSEGALKDALMALCEDYTWLAIEGLVGDFGRDLAHVPRKGRRMVAFLGSTLGNFEPETRPEFYRSVAAMLEEEDHLLLGVDLVKDEATLVAAYDDAAGVTAEFNRNILAVVNRELQGDLPLDAFVHVTRFNPANCCMEQSLRATRPVDAYLAAIDLPVHLDAGEEIHTEKSCKFTRACLDEELGTAGLVVRRWWTDRAGRFAVLLAGPR